MELRNEMIETAIKFLGNKAVLYRPEEEKRSYLLSRGLTANEIGAAFAAHAVTRDEMAAKWTVWEKMIVGGGVGLSLYILYNLLQARFSS
eukprot:m.28281 g.28281  ORF g.28281 m.28281 type:complete len:90 (+) comp9457_c0_seq5:50-319(+)